MTRFFRFSPFRLALNYIALSVLVLALFAVPLWYAWHENIATFRAYVHGEDMQRLVDVFNREGAQGLASAMESQAASLPKDEIMVLADASKRRLAGNLSVWPPEVPDAPGTYGLVLELVGGSSMRVVASHARLPGGYHLLMGRESARFQSLVDLFWYGIAGTVGIVLVLGAAIGWAIRRALLSEVKEISHTASAIVKGDFSRRISMRGGSDELDTLAQTVNGMLEQLARQNAQLEDEVAVRKQAEQALHRTQDGLEGLIAQRTLQLARANESLRRSETYLAEAQRLSHTGSFSWCPATGEMTWSYEAYRIYEYGPDIKPAMDLARRRIHPEDLALFDETARRIREEPKDFAFEHRLLMPSGAIKYLRLFGRFAENESRGQWEALGAVMDVTAEHLAQKSLEHALQDMQALKEQFQLAIDTIPGLVWSALPDGHIDFLNQRWREYTGLTLALASGWGWQVAIHPDDVTELVAYWKSVLASGAPGETTARLRRFDGEYRRFLFRGVPLLDEAGKVVKWYGTNTDIEDRTRAEAFLAGEKRLLETIAKGTSLSITLDALCRFVEEGLPGSLCSILLMDQNGGRLHHGAAPSLPESYTSAVNGWPLSGGPCGMAAALCEQVIAADIASDDRWQEYKALAAAHGLRACWSTPIVSSDGKVLGTFAMLSREPGSPTPRHLSTIEQVTHIASIAIERKRADEELQKQKAHLNELFDLAPDAIVLTDLSHPQIIRVNKEFTRMFGYTADEAVGRRLRHLITPEGLRPAGLAEDPDLLAGRKVERQVVRQRKDGTRFHAQVTAARVQLQNEEPAAYLIYRDITERKEAEDRLKRSEAFLAEGQKISRTGSWGWELSSGRVVWSEEQYRMLGFEPGSIEPSVDLFFTAVHPEDRARVQQSLEEATRERRSYVIDYRVILPDGSLRYLRSVARPVATDTGNVEEYIGVTTDTTDRMQVEAALRRAQRLEATGTLAGGIAHDFNNILGAILGYGEMALRDAPNSSRLRRDLESIMSAGERGRALVERILMFSRSGMGERIAVHVEKLVREALDLISGKLPNGVRVDASLQAGRAAMMGDPTQVHQVVMNLATNAIQAMTAGGTLRVSLYLLAIDTPRVATMGSIAAGEYIVLQVADEGEGIAPEILDRIFDPFFTTKEVTVGTGLGLSLVHGIVTEVGGAIDVASVPGSGCAFTVYLPRAGDAHDVSEDMPSTMPRGDQQHVLIVDDEEPLVRLATSTLEELGYRPFGFTSSAAALEAFRADPQRFDAVITDERMPGLSGSSLIREMRGIRRSVPILLVSGYVGEMILRRAYNSGATEVLKKPLSARDLATSLARVFRPR
jgi:PAS domain S-box-containing protein